MRIKLPAILTVSFYLTVFIAFSQSYPVEPEKFYKTLEKNLNTANRSRADELLKAFEPVFLEQLSGAQQEQVMLTVNKFDELRFRVYPDMADYLWSIVYLYQNNHGSQRASQFHDFIDKLDDDVRRKKPLLSYLEFSKTLFNNTTLYETQTQSVSWRAHTTNFELDFEKEPVVHFKNIRLACYSKGDSLIVYNTSGTYYTDSKKFVGEGGKSLWNQSGFNPTEVYAEIQGAYEIDMRKPEYTAEKALFMNKKYFSEPVLGKLEDKVLAIASEDRRSYPRFMSANSRIPIRNIIEGVDYDGGFAQHGPKFLGAGTNEEPASIIINREGKPQMVATSNRFTIRMTDPEEESEEDKKKRKKDEVRQVDRNRITSGNARVIILAGQDSIIHPGIKFTLFTDERQVNLVRGEDDLSASPYYNDFHKVEMQFELLDWKIDEPLMKFTSLVMTQDKRAVFTSDRFFKEILFDRLMGAGSKHPLSYIKLCVDKNFSSTLTVNQMCECLSLPPSQVVPMMYRYQIMGFVELNEEEQLINVKDKVKHQVLSRSKRSDYDVLRILSDVSGNTIPNAKLNLLNYDLTIDGVSRIILSDSHNVQIFPDGGRIVMKKNRDFDFSGMVAAGRSEFFGSEFEFKYDDFIIDMPIVDSLQLWAQTNQKDKNGNKLEARVQTIIEDLQGELKIDRSNNKSGLKSIKKYPEFISEKESYAYYDHGFVHDKVYSRDKFYFQLEPFTFDSLDNFGNEDIRLKGTLASAGIFPDIDETLVLQSDYSLGFTMQAPEGGYPVYGGKGNFEQTIDLSNKGLRGDGPLHYIEATAVSNNFIFFPDSVNGITQAAEIEGQFGGAVEYPELTVDTSFVHWRPYKDYMDISSVQGASPLDMYTGTSEHTGTVRYSPTGMVGWGMNHFEGANLYSDLMVFKFTQLLADTCNFEIPNDLLGDVNFSSENLKADVNFQTREAKFISNTGKSLTDFGAVKYNAFLDRFTWKMDAEEIEYSAEGEPINKGAETVQVEGAEFISVQPKQDSLRWFAKGATYNYKESIIQARGIEFIEVADANIIPGDGEATVRINAAMDPLDSATVVANRITKHHTIYEATVNVKTRWNYNATGKYDYLDENKRKQVIYFDQVAVDSSRQSFAQGIIADEANFTLSPAFFYKGDVRLEANEKPLIFSGYGKLNHSCSELPLQWFGFNSSIDPEDINIRITSEANNENGTLLEASAMIPVDSTMYGTFMASAQSASDIPVGRTEGYLMFDKTAKEYRLASLEKLAESSIPGNYVSMNTETCRLHGKGKFTVTGDIPHMTFNPVGTYDFNSVEKAFNTDFIAKWEFLFDDGLWEIITKEIQAMEQKNPVDVERPTYALGLRELLGRKEADEMLGRMGLGKAVRLPDILKGEAHNALVFSDLAMTYVKEEGVYRSKGEMGIGNIGKELLNIYVEGGLELENKRTGTDMFLYLNLEKNYYVFKYRASSGIMLIYSSNTEFMEALQDVKNDNRRIKASKTNRQFFYQAGSKRLRSEALTKFSDEE
jgi:hypothetical protein